MIKTFNFFIKESADLKQQVEKDFLFSFDALLHGMDGKDITNKYQIDDYSNGYMITIFSSHGINVNDVNKVMKSFKKSMDNLGLYTTSEGFNVKSENTAFQIQIKVSSDL
jgi:hypothetical protein